MLAYFICLPFLVSVQTTPADLEFGRSQVEQFMRDRPEVKPVLIKETALRNHLEKGFGGLETGFRVHWENREPEKRRSEYWPRYDDAPARVRVSKAPSISGSDKCVTLVIELEHAKSETRFNAYRSMAYFDQMTREDYARTMTHLEFQSAQRAREFFKQHPLPPSEAGSDYNWLLRFPTEFSDYLKWLTESGNRNPNLVESWRKDYDKLVSQRKYDVLRNIPAR
jgi:hypothetical protein